MTKKTPLYQKHIELGAKMVSFAGWDMPISYPAGIIAEHKAVRSSCGVFDIGHMGLIKLKIKNDKLKMTELLLNKICTNDASKLKDFSCQYSVICNEEGGVVDDVLIYKLPDYYMVVVNASNTDKVLDWFSQQANGVGYEQMSTVASMAIQGPRAEDVVVSLFGDENIKNLKKNHCLALSDILISRTGYTGEDGFELYVPKDKISDFWDELINLKVQPCGLGARDSLRLEAGLPLYGHEYDKKTTPLEAGYSWAVKFNKEDFVGKKALEKEKSEGLRKKLVGIVLSERAIPREGFKVFNSGPCLPAGRESPIGEVTSGTFSPSLEKPIAMAYINESGDKKVVDVEIREKRVRGEIVNLPFYHRAK